MGVERRRDRGVNREGMVERRDDRGRVMAVIFFFFPYQAGSRTLTFPSICVFFLMQTLILSTTSHSSLTFLFISIHS